MLGVVREDSFCSNYICHRAPSVAERLGDVAPNREELGSNPVVCKISNSIFLLTWYFLCSACQGVGSFQVCQALVGFRMQQSLRKLSVRFVIRVTQSIPHAASLKHQIKNYICHLLDVKPLSI